MVEQKQDNRQERFYNSSVLIQDVSMKTSRDWWAIKMSGEKGWQHNMMLMMIVGYLFLWLPCGIHPVPKRKVCGLLANRGFFPRFEPLIFSMSSLETLWDWSCWVQLFSLVIHSGMSVSSKHLFLSIANLLLMEINFWNRNPYMQSMARRFPIWYFLHCCTEWIDLYFCLTPFFNSFWLFFFMLFIYPAFLLSSLRSYMLLQNCFVSLSSVWWCAFVPSTQALNDRSQNTNFNCYPIYPTPPLGQDMTQGHFLSGV